VRTLNYFIDIFPNYFIAIFALDRHTARCSSLAPPKQLPERTSEQFYPREGAHASTNTASIQMEPLSEMNM